MKNSGMLPAFGFNTPNPAYGNLPGAAIFEGYGPGKCNCSFASNYPYDFGPRLGVAYQITPKTVFRGGIGVSYAQTAASGNGQPAFWIQRRLRSFDHIMVCLSLNCRTVRRLCRYGRTSIQVRYRHRRAPPLPLGHSILMQGIRREC